MGSRDNGNKVTFVLTGSCKVGVPGTVRNRFDTVIRGTYSSSNGRLRPSRVFSLFRGRCEGIYNPCELLGCGVARRGDRDRRLAGIRFANRLGCGSGRPIGARNCNSNPVNTFYSTVGGTKLTYCRFISCDRRTVSINSSSGTVSCVRVGGPRKGSVFNVNISRGVNCTSVGNVVYTVGHSRGSAVHSSAVPNVFSGY